MNEEIIIRVSDVPTYEMCPVMFYLQRIKGYYPKRLKRLFSIGVKEHKEYESKEQEIHEQRETAKDREPYVEMFQEKKLFDRENMITGRFDTLYLYGTSLNSNNDKRKILIVDKKRTYHDAYLYQLYGYAHLVTIDNMFSQHKPFDIFVQIVHNKGKTDEIKINSTHINTFLQKVNEIRNEINKMLNGYTPQIIEKERCNYCVMKPKCFGDEQTKII